MTVQYSYMYRSTGEYKLNTEESEQVFNTVGRHLLENLATISASQRDVLEQQFAKDPYPKKSTVYKISEQLGLAGVKMYDWFRWERYKKSLGKSQKIQSNGEFVDIHVHSVLVQSRWRSTFLFILM